MTAKILVTGGSGLLGNALKEVCPEAIYTTRKDSDLTDLCQVRNLFKKIQPQIVLHLAAKVAGVKTNAEKIADMYTVNTQINTNVLNVAQEFKVKKLVAVLSNCVFQEKPPHPPTEKDIHTQMPFRGHMGYGYAKRMLDLQIHLLHEQYGCNFTSITPVTIFGPFDNWNFNEGHVVGALINKCYTAKIKNQPFTIWGSGQAIRQFIYSYDVARVLMRVLKDYNNTETIIVAEKEGTAIRTLAELIAKIMNFEGHIVYDTTQPEGESIRVLDQSKFNNLFPDFKFTPIEDALKSTIQWYLKNHERILTNVH
ncbi:MAG: NAD-dependent epimerase/dehydratase family protein [Elusimicrobia bacterium]|nr:NAD-dependent epimerase/dehydratase family protein [Elusimicrobiota bacterium]